MATAPLGSTARTNQLLSEASKQTGIKTPTFTENASPSQVAATVTNSVTNPRDLPGYVPGTLPGDKPSAQASTQSPNQPTDTSKVQVPPTAPNQAQVNPPNQATDTSVPSGIPGMPNLTGSQSQQAGQAIDQLKQKYGTALADIKSSGVASPANSGAAAAGVNAALATQPKAQPIPKSVENFLNPDNPAVLDSTQQLMEFLNPTAEREQLNQHIQQLASDRSELSSLKTDLMNTKRIMAGTEGDIRDEITKSGGFSTESMVQAMTIARNKTLVQKAQLLTDQIQSQTDLVNSDVSLVGDEKQLAAQQFTQRMSLLNYQQENTKNAFDALKDSYKTLMDVNPQGLYNSLLADPTQAQRFTSITGLPMDSLKGVISTKALDNQLKQAQIAKIYNDLNGNGTGIGGNTNITTPSGSVNVPTALSPYVQTAYDGTLYADLSSLTPSDKAKYAQISQQAGIKPILDTGTAGKLNAISVSKENLQTIGESLPGLLNNETTPTLQGLSNSVSGFLGNADVKSFNAWRTAIINNVQALAGGAGSGLRINKAEIDSAMQNDLPVITGANADNLSTAQAKLAKLNFQLDTWNKQILGGGNTANTHIPPVGTVIESGGKSYHVIDDKGNLEPI